MKTKLEYVNFKKFEDEFGNLLKEFEVIQYYKLSDGTWSEASRTPSTRQYYEVDGQLYFKSGNSLIPMNMDFDSENCGACYKIGNEIVNHRKITGNFVLIVVEFPHEKITLKKQTYANNTCFYSLQDSRGNFKVNHASSNINDLISQLMHENNVYIEGLNKYNNETVKNIIECNNTLIEYMQSSILNVA